MLKILIVSFFSFSFSSLPFSSLVVSFVRPNNDSSIVDLTHLIKLLHFPNIDILSYISCYFILVHTSYA